MLMFAKLYEIFPISRSSEERGVFVKTDQRDQ